MELGLEARKQTKPKGNRPKHRLRRKMIWDYDDYGSEEYERNLADEHASASLREMFNKIKDRVAVDVLLMELGIKVTHR